MAYQSHIHRRDPWTDIDDRNAQVQIGRLALSKRSVWLLIAALAVIGLVLTLTTAYAIDRQLTVGDYRMTTVQPREGQLILEPACSPYAALSGCIVTTYTRPLPPA